MGRKNKSKRVYKRRNTKQFGGEVSDVHFNELVAFINTHALKNEDGKYVVEMENRSGGETNVYYSTGPNQYKELCFCKVINYNLGHKGIQFCFQIPDALESDGLQYKQLKLFVYELNNLYENNSNENFKLFKETVNSFELRTGGRSRFSIVELFTPTSYFSINKKEDSDRGTAAQTFFNRFNNVTVTLKELGYEKAVGNKEILYIDLLNNNQTPQGAAAAVPEPFATPSQQDN
jgi:hypothetical protein